MTPKREPVRFLPVRVVGEAMVTAAVAESPVEVVLGVPVAGVPCMNQLFQGHFPLNFDNNCAVDTWGLSTC